MTEKYKSYYGVRFCRDDKTGYYLNTTLHIRAHRFVWERHKGPIPDGMHIHHIDGDKSNNEIDNLELMSPSDHLSMHMKEWVADPEYKARMDQNLDNIRHLTKEWHSSEEGLEWHRQHGINVFQNIQPIEFICEECGKDFKAKPLGVNKFCSNACKSAYRRRMGFDDVERVCLNCSTKFTTNKYTKNVTCSRPCTNTYRKYCKDHGLEYPRAR